MAHSLVAAAQLNEPKGAPKLPSLQHVRSHQLYRTRDHQELEEATWPLEGPADHPPSFADPMPVRLCSMSSETEAIINFHNKSGVAVRALWVDFGGNEVSYSALEPNTTKRYRTYATHPWIVREVTTGMRMMLGQRQVVVGAAEEVTVEISLPPRIHWMAETHTCFPDAFKTSTRALLLAHKRLENAAAAAMHPTAPSGIHIPTKPSAARAFAAEPYGVMDSAADADMAALDQQKVQLLPDMPDAAAAAAAAGAAGMRLKRSLSEPAAASPPTKAASPNKAASPSAVLGKAGTPVSAGSASPAKTPSRHVSMFVDAMSPVAGRGGAAAALKYSAHGPAAAGGGVRSPKKGTVFRSLMGALRHGLISNNSAGSTSSLLSRSSSAATSPATSPLKTNKSLKRTAQRSLLMTASPKASPQQQSLAQAVPQSKGPMTTAEIVLLGDSSDVAAAKNQKEMLPAGSHLGLLPHHLVVHIIELLACEDVVLQHINREAPIGRVAILPALLAGPPPEATAPAAAGAAAAGGADGEAAGGEQEEGLQAPVAAAEAAAAGGAVGAVGMGGVQQQGQQQQGQQGQQQQEGEGGDGAAGGLVGLQEEPLLAAAAHFLQNWHNAFMAGDDDGGDDIMDAAGDAAGDADDEGAAGQLPLGWAPLEHGAAAVAAAGGGGDEFAAMLMEMLMLEQQAQGEAQAAQAPAAQDE